MELKYFKNCKDMNSLRKEYLKLIKKYHPDLATNQEECESMTRICAEINSEYDTLVELLPKMKNTDDFENNNIDSNILLLFGNVDYSRRGYFDWYKELVGNSVAAERAYQIILKTLQKPNIQYKYYDVSEGFYVDEDLILKEIDATISLFVVNCCRKGITGEEFAKLYELCQGNAEKTKRVIMFLSTGAISENDIHTNLQSDKPIPFFNDNIVVDNLPDYSSFLILSKVTTKDKTYDAWREFCQKQRDDFMNRFSDSFISKLPSGRNL